MTRGELLERLGTDPEEWAAEFDRVVIELGHPRLDREWLAHWFGDAIAAGRRIGACYCGRCECENYGIKREEINALHRIE